VQRLFSMFPNGWPGRSLLLLRLVAGAILIHDGASAQPRATVLEAVILQSLAFLGAALFITGLGTPLASVVLASVELGFAFSKTGHIEHSILMGAIAFAVAALGPGFLSIDAKLYGRKLIVIRDE
jgi:uncharacterized membrane protein YphA (DoxX/SURF4 family)